MNIKKKLTAQQILEIVSANYSEKDFGYGEWDELKSDSKLVVPEGLGDKETEDKKAYWEANKSQLDGLVGDERKNHPVMKEYDNMPCGWDIQNDWILDNLGLGQVDEVAQYGGEGMGDTWYSIKHFKDHDVYIRTDGYYSSYNGTDFNYGYGKEVTPKEKTITVYD